MKSSSSTALASQLKTPWPRRRCMKKLGQRASELTFNSQPDMKWITREKIKVDRVACPWVVKKIGDPRAEFVFLPPDTDWAKIDNGTAVDVPHCELGHHGAGASFNSILKKYNPTDPRLR